MNIRVGSLHLVQLDRLRYMYQSIEWSAKWHEDGQGLMGSKWVVRSSSGGRLLNLLLLMQRAGWRYAVPTF